LRKRDENDSIAILHPTRPRLARDPFSVDLADDRRFSPRREVAQALSATDYVN
jgi:hypothetical protein